MGYDSINMVNVKARNQSSILRLLNDAGPTPRKDIAAGLGLTPSGVTTLCADLIQEGVLYELGEVKESNKVGRRKVLVDINYEYRYVLAISIETPTTCVTICDLRGGHSAEKQVQTDSDADPAEFLRTVADVGKALMWEAGVRRNQLLGVGVSVPGPVDHARGVSRHAYRIWDKPVSVAACLGEYFECPVLVENNIKAFAQAELLYGMGRAQKNLVFLKWGPGVGSCIIINGQIYESDAFKNAEIGHVRVDMDGEPCRCGRHGCLETKVSSHSLVRAIQAGCSEKNMPKVWEACGGRPENISVHDLPRLMALADDGMWRVLDERIEMLADLAGAILTMLAPDRLVVYGNIFGMPQVLQRFRAACRCYDPAYDDKYVAVSEISEKIDYIGPLAMVTNELFYKV